MAQLNFSKGKFAERDWSHFVQSVKDATEKWDFETNGFVERPAGNIVKHKLKVQPKCIMAFESNDRKGASYDTVTITAVGANEATIGGSKTYIRVLANK